MIEKSLAAFPQRDTDGAYIIRCCDSDSGKGVAFKLNANSAPPVLVERYVEMSFRDGVLRWNLNKAVVDNNLLSILFTYRSGGHERQYGFSCPRCNLMVAYQSTPPPAKSGPYLYILKGALTVTQGQVPKDAFEGFRDDQEDLGNTAVHQT